MLIWILKGPWTWILFSEEIDSSLIFFNVFYIFMLTAGWIGKTLRTSLCTISLNFEKVMYIFHLSYFYLFIYFCLSLYMYKYIRLAFTLNFKTIEHGGYRKGISGLKLILFVKLVGCLF